MSLEQAQSFLSCAANDISLQQRVDAADWNLDAMTRIAEEAGFKVSSADLQAAMDAKWGGELNEQQLGAVVGGGGNGVVHEQQVAPTTCCRQQFFLPARRTG